VVGLFQNFFQLNFLFCSLLLLFIRSWKIFPIFDRGSLVSGRGLKGIFVRYLFIAKIVLHSSRAHLISLYQNRLLIRAIGNVGMCRNTSRVAFLVGFILYWHVCLYFGTYIYPLAFIMYTFFGKYNRRLCDTDVFLDHLRYFSFNMSFPSQVFFVASLLFFSVITVTVSGRKEILFSFTILVTTV
jgi:hypothetical protein